MRSLNKTCSAFIALLLAVALFGSWSLLGNKQLESVASGNEFGSNVMASVGTELRQNLTIKGDIIVDSGTYLIENVNLNLTGKIIASNDATVIIRNSTLFVTTPGYNFRDAIVLADRSTLMVENATVFLESANTGEESYITLGDESVANITDSELHGVTLVIGQQNSRIYVNRSILEGPSPVDLYRMCGVITSDNSTARIQDSELDTAQARGNSSIYVNDSTIPTQGVYLGGNSLVEIENSLIGYVETSLWLPYNSSLRILNSTVEAILFSGLSLTVEGSRVTYWLQVEGNSTAWLTNVSASDVIAKQSATVWLINSYSEAISAEDQGRINVGWRLPLFGILALPHNWIPILQGIAVLVAIVLIIALLVVLNRRWNRWRQWKLKERALLSDRP